MEPARAQLGQSFQRNRIAPSVRRDRPRVAGGPRRRFGRAHLCASPREMNVQTERVTVIIPVRDEEASIGRLLESLAAQTCVPARVLVVDAGSMDRTRDIVADYARRGAPAIDLIEA